MSSFGGEYTEVTIVLSEKLKYTFDDNIDVAQFCDDNNIRYFEDFDWYAMQKFLHTYFEIDLDDGSEFIEFKYNIIRNLWAEFEITIDCLYCLSYNEVKFESLIRKLKIKKFLEENEY